LRVSGGAGDGDGTFVRLTYKQAGALQRRQANSMTIKEGGAPWDDFTKPGYKDLDLGELMPPHLGMVMGC